MLQNLDEKIEHATEKMKESGSQVSRFPTISMICRLLMKAT